MMRSVSKGLAVCLCAFLATSCDWIPTRSPEGVMRGVESSVFAVAVEDYRGSVRQGGAVAVSPDLVVTNKHVVGADLVKTSITLARKGQTWRAFPTYYSNSDDLCVLRVPGLTDTQGVRLRNSRTFKVGERVVAVGNPLGLELSVSEGLIAGLRQLSESEGPLIQTTAAISPGSSGGGLFDLSGRLVGITTSRIEQAENIAFAIAADEVQAAVATSDLESSRLLERAAILLASGNREEGRDSLRKAIQLEPALAVARIALALAEPTSACDVSIREGLIAATQADPALVEGWRALGDCYSDSALRIAGARALREVGDLNPLEAPVWAEEPVLWAQAIGALERAHSLAPGDPDVIDELADGYLWVDLFEKAKALLRNYLASNPRDIRARESLASAHEAAGEHRLAIELCREVVAAPASTSEELGSQESCWITLAILAGNRAEKRFCVLQREDARRRSEATRAMERQEYAARVEASRKDAEPALAYLRAKSGL